jgi:hypothetical protein
LDATCEQVVAFVLGLDQYRKTDRKIKREIGRR